MKHRLYSVAMKMKYKILVTMKMKYTLQFYDENNMLQPFDEMKYTSS